MNEQRQEEIDCKINELFNLGESETEYVIQQLREILNRMGR